MNRRSSLLLIFLLHGAAWAEGLKEIPSGDLAVSAQDATGTVWAFGRGGDLRFLDRERWQSVSVRELVGWERSVSAFAAAPMVDGGVAVLWRVGEEAAAVTRHEGGTPPRLLATFACPIPYKARIELLGDSQNRLWFTFGRDVHWLAGQGEGGWRHWSHTVADEWFQGGSVREYGTNPIALVEDGRGRVWAYGSPLNGAANFATLAGVLIFDGGKEPAWHRSLGGLGVAAFGTLSRKDDAHLWLPVLGKGLFEIETDTLAIKPVPPPRQGAFTRVAQVLPAGKGWIVTAGAPDRVNWSLWRLENGRWDCPVPHFASRSDIGREHGLATPFGFLAALPGEAAWLLNGDETVRLDWQAAIPARAIVGLHRLPGGGLILVDKEQSVILDRWKPGRRAAAPRVAEVNGGTGRATPDGHLWLANEPDGLKEWDGERWTEHPAPRGMQLPYRIETFARDKEGWFWLLSASGDGPVVLYHPGQKRWLSYKELDQAFLARRESPARWPEGEMGQRLPAYSADGRRIAFVRYRVVRYFDGEQWTDFQPEPSDREEVLPFFDEEGRLCVIAEGSVRTLAGGGKWETRPATPAEERAHGIKKRRREPEGRFVKDQNSLVVDNRGTRWGTSTENGLFKARDGRTAFIFSKGEVDPFRGRQEIAEAWVDASGNAFLKFARREKGWVCIAPKFPAPRTRIKLTRLREDACEAAFETGSTSKMEFSWQFDGAPPQTTSAPMVRFDFLPAGKHRLSVQAVDEELQVEAAPAVAEWEVKVDADAQLGRTIAALGDPERRAAALAALALQPERSVPALRKAREGVDGDRRWWIDAALGEIARRAR